MELRHGVIKGYDGGTHTATVQLEGNAVYVSGVPVSRGIAGAEVVVDRVCAVGVYDRYEVLDSMVLGVY